MTKKDIIKEVSKITDYTQKDISYVIDTFINVVKQHVKNDETVKITGFMSISKEPVKATNRYNIHTGQIDKVEATSKIKATIGSTWE